MSGRRGWFLAAALAWALAGCSPLLGSDQMQLSSAETPAWLVSGHSIGQTFVAHEGGLSGLEVYLLPGEDGPAAGTLELLLTTGPHDSSTLAQASLPAAAIAQPGYYRFSFASQAQSWRRDYYALLTLSGEGRVGVGLGPGPAYADGALYQDGEPADAQMAFRLAYAPQGAAREVAGQALGWAGWLGLAALLMVVPGGAVLAWLWPEAAALSWGERLGLAAGLGFALYPLLLLWTHQLGLQLGAWNAWLPIAAGLLGCGLLVLRGRVALGQVFSRAALRRWWTASGWPDVAFVAVLGLVAFSRWWAARDLDLPLFGDSLQHTMIVQLLLDHGGLFSAWAPYAPMTSFTYHFGFHSLAAAFGWVSGLSAAQATLWMGQILNVLAVLVLYPLGVHLSGQRWGGVLAMLAAGLLSPHPAYYINWGRYTQLAGQVLLPVAVYFIWALAEPGLRQRRGLVALGALAAGGLALTHYRVLLMYGSFVVAVCLVTWRAWRRVAGPLLALAAGAMLLALPWLLVTLGGPLMALTGRLLTTAAAATPAAIMETVGLPDPREYPVLFWLLAALGLWAGWRWRRSATVLLLAWWALLILAAHPRWVGLPGSGLLTNFAVLIAGYIGGALMASAGAAWLARPGARTWGPAIAALLGALALWGAWQRMHAVDIGRDTAPGRADQRAARWIDGNLPQDARLLTRTEFGLAGTLAVGADAGVWLPLLARRAVTTPPLNYAMEQGGRPDFRAWVEALPRAIASRGLQDPAVLAMLRERGVTHLYIGQRRGSAVSSDPLDIQPADLVASSRFRPIYHEDRVWVFELLP